MAASLTYPPGEMHDRYDRPAEYGTTCACVPARLCGQCEARGYKSGLAGYAARIYPASCTPADDARELRVHYTGPDDEGPAYDTCTNCAQPVTDRGGQLVTMVTGNPECYGTHYRPEH